MTISKKYWTPENFEVSSYQFRLGERVNATYNCSGSDTTEKCIYAYNELGFRGDSIFKEGFMIINEEIEKLYGIKFFLTFDLFTEYKIWNMINNGNFFRKYIPQNIMF